MRWKWKWKLLNLGLSMVINTRIRHHSLNNVSGNTKCSEYGFGF